MLDRPENDPKMQAFIYPKTTVRLPVCGSSWPGRALSIATSREPGAGRFYPQLTNLFDVRRPSPVRSPGRTWGRGWGQPIHAREITPDSPRNPGHRGHAGRYATCTYIRIMRRGLLVLKPFSWRVRRVIIAWPADAEVTENYPPRSPSASPAAPFHRRDAGGDTVTIKGPAPPAPHRRGQPAEVASDGSFRRQDPRDARAQHHRRRRRRLRPRRRSSTVTSVDPMTPVKNARSRVQRGNRASQRRVPDASPSPSSTCAPESRACVGKLEARRRSAARTTA